MGQYILAIIQESARLAAVICQRDLKGYGVKEEFHKVLPDEAGLEAALLDLKLESSAKGLARAWLGTALVCLAPDQGVFHDASLPPVNSRMAKKSLALLLDGEFPFNMDEFARQTLFGRDRETRQLHALTTLVPRATLALWRDSLLACGLDCAKIWLAPWPLPGCMSNLVAGQKARFWAKDPGSKDRLLLYAAGEQVAICAMNARMRPLRIQQLQPLDAAAGNGNLAAEFSRQCRLQLAGLPLQARELLLHGEIFKKPGLLAELEKAFAMPARVLGADMPWARGNLLPGQNSAARLLALCMARQGFGMAPGNKAQAFVARGRKGPARPKHFRLAVAAAALLLVCAGVSLLLEALDSRARAGHLRQAMLGQLQAALGDAPKNASMGKLRSILNSRITGLEAAGRNAATHVVLRMLQQMHLAVPATLGIDVHRLNLDDRHLRLYGQAASFAEVNALREHFARLDGISGSRIVNAANRNDKRQGGRPGVDFELDLSRGQP